MGPRVERQKNICFCLDQVCLLFLTKRLLLLFFVSWGFIIFLPLFFSCSFTPPDCLRTFGGRVGSCVTFAVLRFLSYLTSLFYTRCFDCFDFELRFKSNGMSFCHFLGPHRRGNKGWQATKAALCYVFFFGFLFYSHCAFTHLFISFTPFLSGWGLSHTLFLSLLLLVIVLSSHISFGNGSGNTRLSNTEYGVSFAELVSTFFFSLTCFVTLFTFYLACLKDSRVAIFFLRYET